LFAIEKYVDEVVEEIKCKYFCFYQFFSEFGGVYESSKCADDKKPRNTSKSAAEYGNRQL
jgi:hypothetical protein